MSDRQEQGSGQASSVQQGIWLNEFRTEMRDAYHLPFTISFDGELDTASIHAACTAVLGRHDVLSWAFGERDGRAYVRPAECVPQISQADLSGLPPGPREAELEAQIRRSIQQPFDLRTGPLVRVTLYSLSEARHVLLLVAHHLVFDGRSMEIFARDLLRLYELAASGHEPDLPELRYSAGEYAVAEERRITDSLSGAQQFWRDRWAEPDQMLLPGVITPIRAADAGEQVGFTVDGSLRAKLLNVCQDLDITEFDFLLASLYCLLCRYGNDLPAITIALGLRPAEYKDHIGPFAQELPLVLPVRRSMAFRDFTASLHDSLRELYKYRVVPLNRARTGVRPSALHTAVALSYLRVERDIELPHLEVHVDRMPNSWVRGALWTLARADDSALNVMIRYPGRVLTGDGAQRIAGHWRHVIEQVTVNPDARIGTLSLLTEVERQQVLVSCHEVAAVRRPGTVLDLVSGQAASRPDQVAVRSATAAITYRDWQAAADGLARRINCLGLARGSVIAVCTDRPIEMLIGLLAVLKSGNAFLAADRTVCLAARTDGQRVLAVLVEPHDAGCPEFSGLVTVPLDARACGCGQCEADVAAAPRPEEKAYIGCYPRPDGSLEFSEYDHQALNDGLCLPAEIAAVRPGDRWLSLYSASSAGASLDILRPVLAGAEVVAADAADGDDGPRLLALIAQHDVTHMQATPGVWQRLLDAGLDNPGLSCVCGGAGLQPHLARRLRRRVRWLRNVYAASGAVGWLAWADVPPDAESIVVGRPIANAQIYLLDEAGALAPIGSAGQLCVTGASLALGFPGHPAATATRFLPDPFGPPGRRLLRTRDRARYLADGGIALLGPADRRIRLRGQYTELADIEARLGLHPGIAQCVVAPRDECDEENGARGLVAYLVTSAACPGDAELDAWLADLLPETVRVTYIALDEFPLTGNGRLDLSRLQERLGSDDPHLPGTGTGPAAEAGEAGEADVAEVRRIWREVLKIGDIGIQDNLFDFGIDSLAVNRISSAIYRKLGIDIPLEVFYDSPTVIEIADVIARARRENEDYNDG
jgi:non-ribosomal peptide synthetase component F/acyl carrier protein